MATIANLGVSLTARVGNFEKGFKKAQKIVKRFSRDITRHIKTITRYGAAITGVAAAATAYMVREQLAAVDSTTKLSRTVGLATQELVGYQHAIELSGGDTEGFNKAVIRMNRSLADAEAGLSTAIREIERAGLEVEDFAGLSTDQRIKLLADRYTSIGDAAGRASFLMNVFGRSGIAIGTLFEKGAEGIEKAQQEAELLGLTFSDIDGQKVEAANDSVTRFGRVITGTARRIAIQLAPMIDVVAQRLTRWGLQGNVTGDTIMNVINSVARGFGKLLDIFNLLKAGWNLFVGVVANTASVLIEPARLLVKAWNNALEFLGVETDRNLERFLDDMTSGLTERTEKAASEMEKAWGDFASGANAKKFESYFKGIQAEAETTGEVVGKALSVPELDDPIASAAETTRRASFRQVDDFSRVAIGGGSAKTKNPQITETNTILKQIEQKISARPAVTT